MAKAYVDKRDRSESGGATVLDKPWQIELAGYLGARRVLKLKIDNGLDMKPGAAEIMRQCRAAGLTTDRRFKAGLLAIERRMAQLHAAYGLDRKDWMGPDCDQWWDAGLKVRAEVEAEHAAKEAASGTDQAASVERPE